MSLYLHQIYSNIYPTAGKQNQKIVKSIISDKTNSEILILHQKFYQLLVNIKLNQFSDIIPEIEVKSYKLHDSLEIQKCIKKYLPSLNKTPNFHVITNDFEIEKFVNYINEIYDISKKIEKLFNNNLDNKNLENDNLENDNLENDNLENDNLENDNLENDNLENDNLENDEKPVSLLSNISNHIKSFFMPNEEDSDNESDTSSLWEETKHESNINNLITEPKENILNENMSFGTINNGTFMCPETQSFDVDGFSFVRRGRGLNYAPFNSFGEYDLYNNININYSSIPIGEHIITKTLDTPEITTEKDYNIINNPNIMEIIYISNSLWERKMLIMSNELSKIYLQNQPLFPEITVGLTYSVKWDDELSNCFNFKLSQIGSGYALDENTIPNIISSIKKFINIDNIYNKIHTNDDDSYKYIIDDYLSRSCYLSDNNSNTVSIETLYNDIIQYAMTIKSGSHLYITKNIIFNHLSDIFDLKSTNINHPIRNIVYTKINPFSNKPDYSLRIGVNRDTYNQLRNANQQIRSELKNPRLNISIWNNSTIEPDFMCKPLSINGD